MTNVKFDYDAGIIGGGPAGSAVAGYLARAGLRCVVFEKQHFPRFHIGESLVPAANRILRDLGLLEEMEKAGFPHKYGAAWTSATGRFADMDFAGLPRDLRAEVKFEERKIEGVNQDYTYHVDRAKFDSILLKKAAALGAEVREGRGVRRVEFPEDDAVRIVSSGPEGDQITRVRVVIDASGRRTLLGRQLSLREEDPYFNQYALYSWFEDFDRGSRHDCDYIFIHMLPIVSAWLWQIPISDSITSFGVVTQKENFHAERDGREKFFWDSLKTRPEVYDRLRAARQVHPFTAEGDYSYGMKQVAGRGYVLVGDAARFVDPIFSSGVSIALNGARQASRSLIAALKETPETSVLQRDSFKEYETTMARGLRNWYEFISLYYRLNILFTYFVQDPRYRLDVLKLLQGDVYDEEQPPVLVEMRRVVEVVENNPDHAWHKMLSGLRSGLSPLEHRPAENEAMPS